MSFLEALFGSGSNTPSQGSTRPSTGSAPPAQPSAPPAGPEAAPPSSATPVEADRDDGDPHDGTYPGTPASQTGNDALPPAETGTAPEQPMAPDTPSEQETASAPPQEQGNTSAPVTAPVPAPIATAPRPPTSASPVDGVTDYLSPFLAGLQEIKGRFENAPVDNAEKSRQRAIASLQEQTARRLIDGMARQEENSRLRLLDPSENAEKPVSRASRWYAEA